MLYLEKASGIKKLWVLSARRLLSPEATLELLKNG